MNKSSLTVVAAVSIVAYIVLGTVMFMLGQHAAQPAGLASAKFMARTPANGSSTPPQSYQNFDSIAGTIVSVTKDSIVVSPSGYGSDVGSSPITVSLTSNTQYFRRGALKSSQSYKAELATFNEQLASAPGNDETYVAPDPFVHEPIDFSSLHVGLPVVVGETQKDTTSSAAYVEVLSASTK